MFASIAAAALAAATPATIAEHQAACAGKDGWSDPAPPIKIFANVYDVGTCGIVSLLITGPRGHILLDAATEEAAPGIAANIQRLGFQLSDVKIIGASHEHYDHVGGLAELQRLTGATVMSMSSAYLALETGKVDADDPQLGLHKPYQPAKVGIMLADGFVVRQGPLAITAHATPGHAPGSTSWSWRSCENGRCVTFVYADSVSAVSSDSYRFSDHKRYVTTFRESLRKIERMQCSLLVTPHPAASNLYDRLAGKAPLIDGSACKEYAQRGRAALDARLTKEQAK
ncbi:subclass B3 metallo-beta-lactamase [Sphingomonas daechungensis]|uniref:subclass B3 metallo-beta-lactamase n=1 Tax=Sphingomonas daechungensis TaxID=1176646 RepID=UPI003783011D